MPRARLTEIDHIDPRWREGRDYQLVCGLDCPLNYREEDWRLNTAKSNRFLPWRWVRDEVGVVPEERGDLALFLVGADIESDTLGEWVLLEFLSEEWFSASKESVSKRYDEVMKKAWETVKSVTGKSSEMRKKTWDTLRNDPNRLKERNQKVSVKTREGLANMTKEAKNAQHRRNSLRKREKWQCTITGKISNNTGLTKYQLNRGIDPSNRKRIDNEQ